MTKTCITCKTTKPAADFYRQKDRADGLSSQCRRCKNQARRLWYLANPGRDQARQRGGQA